MKTSKIIFISLLGTIALIILAALINARVNVPQNINMSLGFISDKKPISSFKVLSVKNCKQVNLIEDDSSFVEVYHPKDSLLKVPDLNFTIKEDTLKVSGQETFDDHFISFSVHFTNSLKRIQLQNATINVESFNLEKLSFDLDQSHVGSMLTKAKRSSIKVLEIFAKGNSDLSLISENFIVDSLNLNLQNSRGTFMIDVKSLDGSLLNNSYINIRQPREISLKRDMGSQIYISNMKSSSKSYVKSNVISIGREN